MRSALVMTSMLALAGLIAGCNDSTAPRDLIAPAAPRGMVTVTGDHVVYVSWLGNTESDLAGYRIYDAACADGDGCPYDPVGTTAATRFTVEGLTNGETRFFAVAAFDHAGNESALSKDLVFDTPRPEGFDQVLNDATDQPGTSGWDFSARAVRAFDDPAVDVYYVRSNGVDRIVAPFVDTDIQDAGYATTLDAIDFAPTAGWSPTGAIELVLGHCYIVRTFDDHYAKLRLTSLAAGRAQFDWAYQIDPGNRELRARPGNGEQGRIRRQAVALAP